MNGKSLRAGAFALLMVLPLMGCRYASNRTADFGDIFQLGAGVTAENPFTGVVPPSLGVYAQATEFVNLGALHFTGKSAEIDGRGLFAGRESRTRFGIGPAQWVRINQDYEKGCENYFKKEDAHWTKRMNSPKMRWWNKPAKELDYVFWSKQLHFGTPLMHRGWQYWENFNLEVAVSEPFISHLGFNVRAGFDPSEIFDFLLGFFTIDFKSDDMTEMEFNEDPSAEIAEAAAPAEVTGAPEEKPAGVVEPARTPDTIIPDMLVIYFDTDKSNIRNDQLPRMEHNLKYLKDNPGVKALIEGHCDERNTTEYNFALGERRSTTVMEYLLKGGIDAARLQRVSKGEEQPVALGHDEASWSQNRRAEFRNW